MKITQVSRRAFLGLFPAAGAALVLTSRDAKAAGSFEPSPWLRIDSDGTITIIVARTEMGQGIRTSLPMIVAEELDADWKKIKVEGALADARKYGDQTTGGSDSVRRGWDTLRKAGAAARAMLVEAAAKQWGVAPEACRTASGEVIHEGRKASYGSLVEAASQLKPPATPKLKEVAQFNIVGKKTARLDLPAKVDGSAQFGLDFYLPGMKFAVLERSPVFGGKLKDFDGTAAKAVAGVKDVIKINESVAVVADSTWAAMEGRKALKVTWEEGELANLDSDQIRATAMELTKKEPALGRKEGDVAGAMAKAVKKIDAIYEAPYQAHAPMEPQNAVAYYRNGECEIWAPTQVPNAAQQAAGAALGILPAKVTVHTLLVGGGFGRRLTADYAVEAALVSKAVNAPVKVIWTREDDMRHSMYRPFSIHSMAGGIDEKGMPIAFKHTMICESIFAQLGFPVRNGADTQAQRQMLNLYAIPNLEQGYVQLPKKIPVLFWRSVYHSQTNFAEECFLDELAALAKQDPYEYRKKLLDTTQPMKTPGGTFEPARLRAVLDSAAKQAGWGKPAPQGRFRGIACASAFGSYTAMVAEVSVSANKIKVHNVWGAMDCGQIINPDTLEAQFESSVVFGLTAAMKSEITIEKGRVKQANFNDVPMLRISETPKIHVELIKSSAAPTGAGEPGVPIVAPAVSNAVFAATGKRLRRMPFKLA